MGTRGRLLDAAYNTKQAIRRSHIHVQQNTNKKAGPKASHHKSPWQKKPREGLPRPGFRGKQAFGCKARLNAQDCSCHLPIEQSSRHAKAMWSRATAITMFQTTRKRISKVKKKTKRQRSPDASYCQEHRGRSPSKFPPNSYKARQSKFQLSSLHHQSWPGALLNQFDKFSHMS